MIISKSYIDIFFITVIKKRIWAIIRALAVFTVKKSVDSLFVFEVQVQVRVQGIKYRE